MPWSVGDVEEHKKGLTAEQKRKWVEVANSALKSCLDKGGNQQSCEASAIRQANGSVSNNILNNISIKNNNYVIRRDQYEGREHIIVPVVMMREGVHNGSAGAVFHKGEELSKITASWNGIPITVLHPEDTDGNYVSANESPEIIEKYKVGRIFYTDYSDGLKAEAWLDEEKLKEYTDAYQHIINQLPLDVSVGVFSDDIDESGNWNGETYESIATNYRPDHLALLPGGVGACSWADGCGVRVNNKGGDNVSNVMVNALRYSGTESTAWTAPTLSDFDVEGQWQNLSAADKGKVASHYLISSSGAETFAELKLPVVNPRTGKLSERALRAVIGGRGAQVGGVSAEQRSAARRKAYRLLNSEFDAGLTIPENLEANQIEIIKNNNSQIIVTLSEMSYQDRARVVQEKLDAMDNDMKVHYLEALYNDYLVYRVSRREGNTSTLYKLNYSVNDSEEIELSEEPVEVKKKIEYVTMEFVRTKVNNSNDKGDHNMSDGKCLPCIKERVDKLITNEATKWVEDDREWLETLTENQLDKFVPEEKKEEKPVVEVNQEVKTYKTIDEYLNALPVEMRDQAKSGMSMYKEQKQKLVQKIIDNSEEGVWTKEELEGEDVDRLNKIASFIKEPVDYSGMGSGARVTNNEEVLTLPGTELED